MAADLKLTHPAHQHERQEQLQLEEQGLPQYRSSASDPFAAPLRHLLIVFCEMVVVTGTLVAVVYGVKNIKQLSTLRPAIPVEGEPEERRALLQPFTA